MHEILNKDLKWDSEVIFTTNINFYNFDNLFVMDVWFPYLYISIISVCRKKNSVNNAYIFKFKYFEFFVKTNRNQQKLHYL